MKLETLHKNPCLNCWKTFYCVHSFLSKLSQKLQNSLAFASHICRGWFSSCNYFDIALSILCPRELTFWSCSIYKTLQVFSHGFFRPGLGHTVSTSIRGRDWSRAPCPIPALCSYACGRNNLYLLITSECIFLDTRRWTWTVSPHPSWNRLDCARSLPALDILRP